MGAPCVIGEPEDIDRFKFKDKKGQVCDFRVFARSLRSPLYSVLSIQRANGAGLAANDDGTTPDSSLRFTAPDDGEYLVAINDHLKQGGPAYVYRIEVTPVEPRLVLSLPEPKAFVDVTAPVPQGNRVAVMVSVQREDCGGEVKLELNNLPQESASNRRPSPPTGRWFPCCLRPKPKPLAGSLADPSAARPKANGSLKAARTTHVDDSRAEQP